ncbi:protein kinase receptor Ret oncogene isoform X3 [Rhodnius prolixus]|uniref:protein kinase receptor Ret oncogene isoform X3 n=1 Tax=Rhodnius prolixus TaxID=13249 RepID=UPI003D18BD06
MSFFLVLFMFFINGTVGIYSPIREMEVFVRIQDRENIGDRIAKIPVLLFTGKPVGRPLPFTFSSGNIPSKFAVSEVGLVTWSRPMPEVPAQIGVTVTVNYKGLRADSILKVSLLPALEDICKPPVKELCFFGEAIYQVYENSRGGISLGSIGPIDLPCKLNRPKYKILRGNGETRLNDDTLWVEPAKMKGNISVLIECTTSTGEVANNTYQVLLLSTPVVLPEVMPPETVRLLSSSSIVKGSRMVIGWACIGEDSKAEDLVQTGNTSLFLLTMTNKIFSSDMTNATLVLIYLTWSKTVDKLRTPIDVKARLEVLQPWSEQKRKTINIKCRLEISTKPFPKVEYLNTSLNLPRSVAPYARLSQPKEVRELDHSVNFRNVIPQVLLSPFNVTRVGGILFVLDWGHLQLIDMESNNTGVLIEWKQNETQLGMEWFQITLLQSTLCTSVTHSDVRLWEECSRNQSPSACRKTCGLGASIATMGTCIWQGPKKNFSSQMTINYSTCSPDINCPDKWCDPLEELNFALCSQDCTSHEDIPLGMKNENGTGIFSGVGICTCEVGKCHCGTKIVPKVKPKSKQQNEILPQPPRPPLNYTQGPVVQTGELVSCDGQCVLILIAVGGCLSIVFASLAVYSSSRGCWPNNKANSRKNYSTDALLSVPAIEMTPQTETKHNFDVDPKWEVPRSRLSIEDCLGEGEFGRVLKATARDLPNFPGFMTVAVKTLKDNASPSELSDLMSEYQLLKEVTHPNVVKLLGACTTPDAPVYIIIEYCALGSLRAYLRRCRNIKTASELGNPESARTKNEIVPRDVLSFAWQISKGMAYLAEIKLVHRDLAARNILLATGKVCKISDFGLTRDVYEDDTYLKKSRGRVPVKWMALESLADHVYTSKSDVWSFGIVLWELVTLGSSPYPGVAVQNLYHLLKNGYRMQRPQNCSLELYEIMKDCWSSNPSDRPSFVRLTDKFERMLEDGADYLDCNERMVSNPAYFGGTNQGTINLPEKNEMEITFTMGLPTDLQEKPVVKYENENVNSLTSYDTPKQHSQDSTPFQITNYTTPLINGLAVDNR